MKRYIKATIAYPEVDKAIKEEFGSDTPSTGCSFIGRDGTFINIYPKLDVHEDLCNWAEDNLNISIPYPDEEYFINLFGYIRLRSDPNMMIIEMPEFAPSNSQWYSLQDWLDYCQEKYRRRVTLDISVYGSSTEVNVQYDFGTEYFSDDIIKVLKRYYSSGKLYASTNKGGHMKRYIRSSSSSYDWWNQYYTSTSVEDACKEMNEDPEEYIAEMQKIANSYGYTFRGFLDAKPEYAANLDDLQYLVKYTDKDGNTVVGQQVNDRIYLVEQQDVIDRLSESNE